jgi:hypothetical protein
VNIGRCASRRVATAPTVESGVEATFADAVVVTADASDGAADQRC